MASKPTVADVVARIDDLTGRVEEIAGHVDEIRFPRDEPSMAEPPPVVDPWEVISRIGDVLEDLAPFPDQIRLNIPTLAQLLRDCQNLIARQATTLDQVVNLRANLLGLLSDDSLEVRQS